MNDLHFYSHEISPTDRNRLRCIRIRFSEKVGFQLRVKQ